MTGAGKAGPALLLIDVQRAMRDRSEAEPWANPDAEARIADLLAAFRAAGLPVIHVHHHGLNPADEFHASAPGSKPLPVAEPLSGEPVMIKHGSSAFIGTDLAATLAALGNPALVIAGGEANFCINSTTRMAGNLGYKAQVASDALINFGQRLHDGRTASPKDVLAFTLADLDSGFADVTTSAAIIAQIASPTPRA
jgi:nicotinamidase-related amidase